MDELFRGRASVRGMSLKEFLKWAKESDEWFGDHKYSGELINKYEVLALPAVQRSAVWTPKKMVDLWDSILSGLPIGMLYLMKGKDEIRGLKENASLERVEREHWNLLDGQQRVRTLLLGLGPVTPIDRKAPREGRCLWIDLTKGQDGRPFTLQLTSESQPFGYDPDTGQKLSLPDRRKAREKIEPSAKDEPIRISGKDRRAYNHELFAGYVNGALRLTKDQLLPRNWPPLPYKSKPGCFIPLHCLLNAWMASDDKITSSALVHQMVADRADASKESIAELVAALGRFDEGELGLLRVGKIDHRQVLQLFNRIGDGGARLTEDEKLFSTYKHVVPSIHNVVNDLYNGEHAGRALPPTKIAVSAIRIAHARTFRAFSA